MAKSCLYHEPVRPIRQAHGPSILLGVLRSGVSLSNPEVLEGSANHHECSYEPRGIRVQFVQHQPKIAYALIIFVGSGLTSRSSL